MAFTENDKLKALAIVHVFETSRPFGDYSACVVLNDGAGVSYGINQFTHRSGSLAAVVREYLANGGQLGREIFTSALPLLSKKTNAAIEQLASNELFKRTLRTAAITSEMKAAQRVVAYERYLRPAIEICERMRFVKPLSLAVVYDSVTHGSWELISARVNSTVRTTKPDPLAFEKSWITEYVRARHRWLTEVRRLRVTNYRTKFLLDQIAIGNWELRLPVTVHGVCLTADLLDESSERDSGSAMGTVATGFPVESEGDTSRHTDVGTIIQSTADLTTAAAVKFDRIDGVITAVTTRKDSAKSLWTTVAGTLSQAIWGIFGFIIGLPRIVWMTVAIIAAVLMFLYLYRQITLGKIRETRR